MASPPLIIAHRGSSGIEPENTLRAFDAAVTAGADGIELDVYRTADRQVVVTHDLSTKRLAGENLNIRKSTLDILRTLDFGKGERIPTLEEVLARYLGRFRVINIEIKSTNFRESGIEKTIAELVGKFDCAEKILISSFNPLNIHRARKLIPGARIGYLIDARMNVVNFSLKTIGWLKPDTLNLHPALLGNPRARVLFDMGIPLWIWNVDKAADWLFWIDKGAEAIITDHPQRLKRILYPEGGLAAIGSATGSS